MELFGLGIPELIIIILVLGVVGLIPITAAVWVFLTLRRIRSTQEVLRLRLEHLEHTLQRSAGQ
jgi:hypothetical protein